jgi:hypothetical protein
MDTNLPDASAHPYDWLPIRRVETALYCVELKACVPSGLRRSARLEPKKWRAFIRRKYIRT